MATRKEYPDDILDQLPGMEGVRARAMMGEYILHLHGRIAAYLCDDRLLVKPVPTPEKPSFFPECYIGFRRYTISTNCTPAS